MRRHVVDTLHRRALSADTETDRIQLGLVTPPMVVASVAWVNRDDVDDWDVMRDGAELAGADLVDGGPRGETEHVRKKFVQGQLLPITGKCGADAIPSIVQVWLDALLDPETVIVGANIAFDLAVVAVAAQGIGIDLMPAIFAAFEAGRIWDVQIAQALDAIAGGFLGKDPRTGKKLINPETKKPGRYALGTVVDLLYERLDAKLDNEYKLRFHEFHGVPVEQLPEKARKYPVDDVREQLMCALGQCGWLPRVLLKHDWLPASTREEMVHTKTISGMTIASMQHVPDGPARCRNCGSTDATQRCWGRAPLRNLIDLANQTYTAFCMHLGAAWGFRVNQKSVDVIERDRLKSRAAKIQPFIDVGLVAPNKKGGYSENRSALKKRVAEAYGGNTRCPVCDGTGKVASPSDPRGKSRINCYAPSPLGPAHDKSLHPAKRGKSCDGTGILIDENTPTSDGGGIAFGRDCLVESGNEFLMAYGGYQEDAKDLKDYVPFLRTARRERIAETAHGQERSWIDIPLVLRPNPLLETGRTSYDGYIQLFKRAPGWWDLPTGEYIPSLRECIEARKGWVLASIDYDSGELVTHAQSCIWIVGASMLADALRAGRKVHHALGAQMLGMTYEQFLDTIENGSSADKRRCKDGRQAAKPPNFGYPGGMGAAKLVLQQRKQGPDTPHPSGPVMIKLEDQSYVPGYKGLRFCLLMDGADRCGGPGNMIREINGRKYPPMCRACVECARRLKKIWKSTWPENDKYFQFVDHCIRSGQPITADDIAMWPHLGEYFYAGQQLAPGEIMQHVSGRIRQVNKVTAADTDQGGSPYCVSGETLAHTREGRVPARELAGRTVATLSEDGLYRDAEWKSYGKQQVFDVVFENGDRIRATAEHRWKVVKPNGLPEWVTTAQLLGRNVPMQHVDFNKRTHNNSSFRAGIRHGLIFGDGFVKASENGSAIVQYKDSMHLVTDYFGDKARVHKSKRYPEGTAFAGYYPPELKTSIPTRSVNGESYVLGYLAGYIASDGSVDKHGRVTLCSSKLNDLEAVRQIAADVGVPSTSIKLSRELNPWNGTPAPLYKLTFSKAAVDPRLIIKNSHRDKLKTAVKTQRRTRVKVVEIRPAGVEEVFCCVEPVTHTWVAGMGYLTGNCAAANGFFQGLLADLAKAAHRRIVRECYDRTVRVPDMLYENSIPSKYTGLDSPLLGSRIIVFQHDELIPEIPVVNGHDAASRISEIMVDEMRHYCPDLAPAAKAPPALMSRWLKGAEPWFARGGAKPADASDTLVPWEPKGRPEPRADGIGKGLRN